MYQCALKSDRFMEKYLKLPEHITSTTYSWFGDGFISNVADAELNLLWSTFESEYDTLTNEQKLEVKRSRQDASADFAYAPRISARIKDTERESLYSVYIPEYMNKTRQFYFQLIKRNTDNGNAFILDKLHKFDEGGYTDEFGRLQPPYILEKGEAVIASNGKILFNGVLPDSNNDKLMAFFNEIDGFVYRGAMEDRYPDADGSYLALHLEWKEYASGKAKKYAIAVKIDEDIAASLYEILNAE